MQLTKRIDLATGFEEAIDAVTSALKDQGFGVLTRIDIKQTLKEKIDVDVEPQVILGACNPGLAHRALGADSRVAALLPCNVVVRVEDGQTVVEALDPRIMSEVAENPDLGPIAEEAATLIDAALAQLSG